MTIRKDQISENYYAVIFTSELTDDGSGYEEIATKMLKLAKKQPGIWILNLHAMTQVKALPSPTRKTKNQFSPGNLTLIISLLRR